MPSPIYCTFNGNGDELFIDLRRITHIVRLKSEMDSSYIHMDQADHDLLLPDDIADPLRDAWIAYHNGEHAPKPAEPAELPEGWRWERVALRGYIRAVRNNCAVTVDNDGNVYADEVPIAVVEAVIARHRAGGAA